MRDARGGAISLQSRLQEAHRALLVSANNLLLYHWYGFIPYFTWWFLSCVQAPRATDGLFIESHGSIFLNYLSLSRRALFSDFQKLKMYTLWAVETSS